MSKKEKKDPRGRRGLTDTEKKVPVRVWAQRREIDERGGVSAVQSALSEAFKMLPPVGQVFDPRMENKGEEPA